MLFHACPITDRKLFEVFQGYNKKESPRRKPMAERANELDRLSLHQANDGNNLFRVFTHCYGEDRTVLNALIPLLNAAYQGKHFGIWQNYYTDQFSLGINVWGAEERLDYLDYRFNMPVEAQDKIRFKLNFFLARDKSHLYLQQITSIPSGMGGAGVTIIYSLARQLGFPEIHFNVNIDNNRARAFYYYYDFGGPVDELMQSWVVRVV